MLIKYLVENTTKNIGISNFIICEISSKFSIIKYEDMLKDTKKTLLQIISFINKFTEISIA